tara:strand:+ start:346 stop:1212 length:867 start_codon:yes stop_codon:yes gene_type:complete
LGKLTKGFAFLLWKSPVFVRRGVGILLGTLWLDILRIRRNIVIENIQRAFPNLSDKEALRLGRKSLFQLGQDFAEYSFLPFLTAENLNSKIQFRGLENLDHALEGKKGVLLLTLHLGHGDLAVGGLSLKGYDMVLVSKFFKLKWLNELWFGMRAKLGTEFIAPRDSSFQLLKMLRKNKVVVIPLDQFTGPPIGVKTTFFGHETGTAAGLAVMSFRSGAAVVPGYTFRSSEGIHEVHLLPQVDMEKFKDSEDAAQKATQHFNGLLEQMIREHPDQWMWIHRRWKEFVVT